MIVVVLLVVFVLLVLVWWWEVMVVSMNECRVEKTRVMYLILTCMGWDCVSNTLSHARASG